MTDFLHQAYAFNRFINMLSDKRDLSAERLDFLRDCLKDIDLEVPFTESQLSYLHGMGILPDRDRQCCYKQLRDELKIYVYLIQLIEAEEKRFLFALTPFYGDLP